MVIKVRQKSILAHTHCESIQVQLLQSITSDAHRGDDSMSSSTIDCDFPAFSSVQLGKCWDSSYLVRSSSLSWKVLVEEHHPSNK